MDIKEILNAMDEFIARLVQARALLTELQPSERIQGLRDTTAKGKLLASATAMSGAKSVRIRRGRGPMSEAARERMAAAQRARWAKIRKLDARQARAGGKPAAKAKKTVAKKSAAKEA